MKSIVRLLPLLLLLACDHDHDHGHGGHSHGSSGHDHGSGSHEHGAAGHKHGSGGHDGHGDDHAHGDEHGHGHGEEAVGITKWTDKFELFAEHPPAVTGEPMPFLAHLTILDGFKPLEEATVTLELSGPATASSTVKKMLRSGIFQPTLVAPKSGIYNASLSVRSPDLTDTVEGFTIQVFESAAAAKKASVAEPESHDEPISFLKEQQWKIPFATTYARVREVVSSVEAVGEVTTPPSRQADIGASISGRIVSPKRGLPRFGQSVKEGELLATIAPSPAAPEEGARAELAVVEAQSRLQAATAAVERANRLFADRAISRKELDDAEREKRVAQESVRAAKRAKSVFSGASTGRGAGTYRVTAPISGMLAEVHATEGKSVEAGHPLFRIVNLSQLWVKAEVPEQQAANLRPDQDAAFRLSGSQQWEALDVTGEDANAKIIAVGRTVDPRSRTVRVVYELLDPSERIRVGTMVRVSVPSGKPWSGVVVPRSAVLLSDGSASVFVQTEGESFVERIVRLGPESALVVGIEEGIEEGERVVIEGANVIRLSSKAASGATGHGHVH